MYRIWVKTWAETGELKWLSKQSRAMFKVGRLKKASGDSTDGSLMLIIKCLFVRP